MKCLIFPENNNYKKKENVVCYNFTQISSMDPTSMLDLAFHVNPLLGSDKAVGTNMVSLLTC